MASAYSALLVAASSQSLSRADGAALSITGDITIEFWIKLVSAPASGKAFYLINKHGGAGNNLSYGVEYANVGGTLKLEMTISDDGANLDTLQKNYTLTTGTWFHVACVWTASTSTVEFFINGSSIGTATGTRTAIYDSASDFYIGRQQNVVDTGYFLDGRIDEIRVWNAVRSASQILATYKTVIDTATNLVASWHLESSLVDGSGNGLTLTNNNTVTFSTDTPALDTGFLNFMQ